MANRVMGYVICGYNSVDNLMSEQSSPFRRWTTGSGAGSSYRHHDHRGMYNKQMSEGTCGAAGGGGGVARWSLGLEQLLADPAGAAAFAHFLAKEFAAENIKFWWSCEQYSKCTDATRRAALAAEIWQQHLVDGAPEPVNIDAAARRAAALRLHQDPSPLDLFQQAQKQIFNVMKFDSYPRFLRSGVHAECARADLRGLPPPYAPPPHDASPKLKKSASNASERRRSGASLLPWRSRGASRERAPHDPPLADIHPEHCKVVLPDGATSVVGVEAASSVRRLVDRLLQRRNLPCATYDVFIKDGQNGRCTALDVSSPSTVLGGRTCSVERRCVVRVELRARCVAVRCRPERRLAHVLRAVLARYPAPAAHVVLRAGSPVHPHATMLELDGARLQIVELDEGEAGEPAERDDDADSLSDLAVRLQDDARDDAQSATSSGARSECGTSGAPSGPTAAPGAPAAAPGPGPAPPAPGARVRAALRPGHPLHHHPPDFLDNLRETQRLRLQPGKTESPRAPPPLPPKPAARAAPTLV